MKKIFVFVSFILLSFKTNAQFVELCGGLANSWGPLVKSICADKNGNVYCAGTFVNSSGNYYVAKWNGNSWIELGGLNSLNAQGQIKSICCDASGNVYAVGNITNGINVPYVAKYNGSNWSEVGAKNRAVLINQNDSMLALNQVLIDNQNRIYVGGTNTYGLNCVSRWDGTGWSGPLPTSNYFATGYFFSDFCIDQNGHAYIIEHDNFMSGSQNCCIVVCDWSSMSMTHLVTANGGYDFSTINDIECDPYGNIYFCLKNYGCNIIYKLSANNYKDGFIQREKLNSSSTSCGDINVLCIVDSNSIYSSAGYDFIENLPDSNHINLSQFVIPDVIAQDPNHNLYFGSINNKNNELGIYKYSPCSKSSNLNITTTADSFIIAGDTFRTSGSFTIDVVSYNGCDSTIHLKLITSATGVENFEQLNNIHVYPNPCFKHLIIDTKQQYQISNVEILNSIGQVLVKNKYNNVNYATEDVHELISGLYLIRIIDSNGNFHTSRFCKE